MADTTNASQSLSAADAAERLEALAGELRREDERADVAVGNKSVSLTPREPMEYGIEVTEREPMLGDKRESITIELNWKANE